MQWASALSTHPRIESALQTVSDRAEELLGGGPDLVLMFVTGVPHGQRPRLARDLSRRFPHATLCGCTGAGVIAEGREIEHGPALAIIAAYLPGVEIVPFHLDRAEVAGNATPPRRWRERLGVADGPTHFILLPDPFTCHTGRLIQHLDEAFPEGTKIGGLASGGTEPGRNTLFLGDQVHDAGVVGVALQGNVAVETVVAQGCRPVGNPLFVTRADRNIVYELDGERPILILKELYESLPERDRRLMQDSLFIGLAMTDERDRYSPGDFLIRNILGLDEASGALALGAIPRENTVVQFHVRDASASSHDLQAMLRVAQQRTPLPPSGALMFSCVGRGSNLFGSENHDTRLFGERFATTPVGGFFCNGEIGPVNGQTFLHGYTSALALFRRIRME